MAKPANPLDVYASYTYHFELHAAGSWDKIKENNNVSELSTTRFASAGTLLINTRKDAHQVIDDVNFQCIGPATSHGGASVGLTELKMMIKEPGGFSFIEKIKARMNELDMSQLSNICFGLKIIFVGRRPNNEVEIKHLRTIPLLLAEMSGNFTPEGGVYQLNFISYDTLAYAKAGPGQQNNFANINTSMSFNATTVEGAMAMLEKKLNEDYNEIYEKKLINDGGAKKLVYKLTIHGEIRGDVVGVSNNSFATDASTSFSFRPQTPISECIQQIIMRSPSLCAKIGASLVAYKNPLHAGAFMPVISPKVYPRDRVVEVNFVVDLYKGYASNGYKIEFDYYFAEPGKNVDVETYNINFALVQALLFTKAKSGADIGSNSSASLQTQDPKRYLNLVHEPVTQTALPYRPPERNETNLKSGDTATPPTASKSDRVGHNALPASAVPSARLAADAKAEFQGAVDPEQTLKIRGHYALLDLCISHPDETEMTSLANGKGIFAKVNVYMLDGVDSAGIPQRRQFFYTGYYNVFVITNNFSGGLFTQQLTMLMTEGFK
jgi:hypothetical protein